MTKVSPTQVRGNSSCFSRQNLERLTENMQPFQAAAGSIIYKEGDAADKLYFLHSGTVKAQKVSEHGKEYTMYLFHQGDLFGQFDPYPDSRHQLYTMAAEDCDLGVLSGEDLECLLLQNGDLALQFAEWMGLMHRITQTKLRDLLMYGKTGALCSTLIRLCNTYGVPTGEGIKISLRLTHSELGEYIGCTRESANRMLGALKKKKAVTVENGYIIVTDLSYLRSQCCCEHCPADVCRI